LLSARKAGSTAAAAAAAATGGSNGSTGSNGSNGGAPQQQQQQQGPSRLHYELLQFAAAAVPCAVERLVVSQALQQLQQVVGGLWPQAASEALLFGSQVSPRVAFGLSVEAFCRADALFCSCMCPRC
jgi:hypothetical protein